MKRYSAVILCLAYAMMSFAYISTAVAAGPLRDKSSVLLIVNNLAKTKYDDKLTEMIQSKLHQKIDRIYNEVDADEYLPKVKGQSFADENDKTLLDTFAECKADYLIYVELQPFERSEGFNFVYYSKSMTAHLLLRIVDLKKTEQIYLLKCDIRSDDSQDYGYIGSASVARKALDSALFKVGEAISVHLPL